MFLVNVSQCYHRLYLSSTVSVFIIEIQRGCYLLTPASFNRVLKRHSLLAIIKFLLD